MSPISAVMEFLNSYQDGTNASICTGIMLKNNYTFTGINELHLTL
jgi:hypothetical protein